MKKETDYEIEIYKMFDRIKKHFKNLNSLHNFSQEVIDTFFIVPVNIYMTDDEFNDEICKILEVVAEHKKHQKLMNFLNDDELHLVGAMIANLIADKIEEMKNE